MVTWWPLGRLGCAFRSAGARMHPTLTEDRCRAATWPRHPIRSVKSNYVPWGVGSGSGGAGGSEVPALGASAPQRRSGALRGAVWMPLVRRFGALAPRERRHQGHALMRGAKLPRTSVSHARTHTHTQLIYVVVEQTTQEGFPADLQGRQESRGQAEGAPTEAEPHLVARVVQSRAGGWEVGCTSTSRP